LDSTLHATWGRVGVQPEFPVTGRRQNIKVFGCVEVYSVRFLYRCDTVFNAEAYLKFLEQMARHYYPQKVIWVQDNASYHKDRDVWQWFKEHRKRWEVIHLPPYSPELNATEALWHHTRITGTHNRYFIDKEELHRVLTKVFRSMQHRPSQIENYMNNFI